MKKIQLKKKNTNNKVGCWMYTIYLKFFFLKRRISVNKQNDLEFPCRVAVWSAVRRRTEEFLLWISSMPTGGLQLQRDLFYRCSFPSRYFSVAFVDL